MVNFPVTITVAPESFDQGLDTLMTKLSHEFSHLYLHSRRDPQRESEYATDLCALMMGFSSFWKRGRKYEKHQANRILVITQGYLSDSQFTYALDYIEQLRLLFWRLIKDISSLRRTILMNYDPIIILPQNRTGSARKINPIKTLSEHGQQLKKKVFSGFQGQSSLGSAKRTDDAAGA